MLDTLLPAPLTPGIALLLAIASFVSSAISATFGIGGGVALISLLLIVLPPAVVLPLHGLVQVFSNAGRAYTQRQHIAWPIVAWFTGGAAIGALAASQVFTDLPTHWITLALAVFILWSLWAPGLKKRAIPIPGYSLVGAVTTFLTLFLGATGPLVAAFWNVDVLKRHGVVATHAAVMILQHAFKVAAFGYLGFAFSDWWAFLAMMVTSGYLGTLYGKRLLARMPESLFVSLFKWTLTLLAARLAFVGLRDVAVLYFPQLFGAA